MGDPETEVVFPRIKNDIVDVFRNIGNKTLRKISIEEDDRAAATVMMVSGGYPGNYEKDIEITGLDKKMKSIVFHAGTKELNGKTVTAGGRVLAVTSLAESVEAAVAGCYSDIKSIHFDYAYYRKDIGRDLIKSYSKA
jgi:phosphoribosylamine---glycine ligase